jgi:hypothetical protein
VEEVNHSWTIQFQLEKWFLEYGITLHATDMSQDDTVDPVNS